MENPTKESTVPQEQSLTQKSGRAALSQIAGGGLMTIIRLGASVFLARALTPADFGVIGMAMLLREFVFVLGSMDMRAGIIVKDDLQEEDLCTFFWSMAFLRIFMFLIAFFGAPLAIYFFDDPRVVEVLRVVSFTFLLGILAVTSNVILAKKLKYFYINIAIVSTTFIESVLAVMLVLYTDLGYWALVVAMLVQTFFYNAALVYLARWYPKFKFSTKSFKYLFRYGINGLGFSITNYLKQNLDYLLVGRLLGAQALGLYEFAYRIPHLVVDRISRPVGAIVMPAFSYIKNDNSQLANGYIKVVRYVSVVTFPLLFGLAGVADIAVPLLWGEQWLSIILPLQILCLCAALRIVVQPVGAIFNCKNRPDLPFKISMVELIWTALAVSILGFYLGVVGVALGMLLSVVPNFVSILISFRLIGASVLQLYGSIIPTAFSSMVCGVSAYIVILVCEKFQIGSLNTLFLSIFTGAIFYCLCLSFLFPAIKKEILTVVESVSGKTFNLNSKKL